MRNIFLLLAVAAACAGCSSATKVEAGGCDVPPPQQVSSDVACAIAASPSTSSIPACQSICNYGDCFLPDSYMSVFKADQATASDGGLSTPTSCPVVDAPVEVHCEDECF